MEMIPPSACMDKPSGLDCAGWYHYIIIGLDQLQTTRTECILTEIHDTAQLGRTKILPEICIMVFSPRAI